MKPTATLRLLKTAATQWMADDAPQLGAALAYYTIFSLAPLIIVAVTVAGAVYGEKAARGEVKEQLASLVGEDAAGTINEIVGNASKRLDAGLLATVAGIGILLMGASGVFKQLKSALNKIWGVQPKPGRGIRGIAQAQFLAFAMVLCLGFLLIVSLIVSSVLTSTSQWLDTVLTVPSAALRWADVLVALLLFTVFFAAIFKVLPDAEVQWRDVWTGAFITSLLFTIGKFLIGLYLGHSAVSTTYGAAASLVVVLIWTYYSAQILLFGAEFTQAFARASGRPLLPKPHAIAVGKSDSDSDAEHQSHVEARRTAPAGA